MAGMRRIASNIMDNFAKIQEIFFSGIQAFRGDYESINEIAFLVDECFLAFDEISIGTKKKYNAFLDNLISDEHAFDIASGGGKNHKALKLLAAEYLKQINIKNIQYEHLFCGYYPDVMYADGSIVVECGHTQNPEKLLAYFQHGNTQECIQIPYPICEDKHIKGFRFVAKDGLKDFLDFRDQQNIQQIKDIKNAKK